MFRFYTAGESHGKGILAFIEGLPAGIRADEGFVNAELRRRQGGYGRGGRQDIEKDTVEFLTGLRRGVTIGSPVTMFIPNRDNRIDKIDDQTKLRPGHADIPGAVKFLSSDVRGVSERSSARETAGRVAAGALCKLFLQEFGVNVFGYVSAIGGVTAETVSGATDELIMKRDKSVFYCLDETVEDKWKKLVDDAVETGDTLGGVVTARATGVPPGLGDHAQWDGKLDAKLAAAMMSIQSIKGVQIGDGIDVAAMLGSRARDEVLTNKSGDTSISYNEGIKYRVPRFIRKTNRMGGIEGGMTTGEDIVVSCFAKPIPTIGNRDIERHDTCAVPAVSVIAEAMLGIVVAELYIESFTAATIDEMNCIYKEWLDRRTDFFK